MPSAGLPNPTSRNLFLSALSYLPLAASRQGGLRVNHIPFERNVIGGVGELAPLPRELADRPLEGMDALNGHPLVRIDLAPLLARPPCGAGGT